VPATTSTASASIVFCASFVADNGVDADDDLPATTAEAAVADHKSGV
jgi:hypothetical protein